MPSDFAAPHGRPAVAKSDSGSGKSGGEGRRAGLVCGGLAACGLDPGDDAHAPEHGRTRRDHGDGNQRDRRRRRWWCRGSIAVIGDDHRPQPVTKDSRMPEDGLVGNAERYRGRRTETAPQPELEDEGDEKDRENRDSRQRRRQATPDRENWRGSLGHAAGFPSSVSSRPSNSDGAASSVSGAASG